MALGNFDGVHRGHRAVIDAAGAAAARLDADWAVATFEPHPRQVFQPNADPFRLTLEPVKARRIAALGVSRLHVLPFDDALRSMSPETFATAVLRDQVGAQAVTVGEDFRFGAKRAGDADTLKALGDRLGFETVVVGPIGAAEGGEVFSSSAVRASLTAGDPVAAARVLGDWHVIEGAVEHGDKRGRTLGYPTANLSLEGVLRPAFGIYAVRAEVRDGPHAGRYDGVASLGLRPTFDKTVPNFETFLFDFNGDIYDRTLSVSLCAYLRPEARFEGIEALIAQMDRDSAEARAVLARQVPPWTED